MGLGGLIRNQFIHIKAINRMTDIFHQEAFNDINRTRSKLRTYGKIKTKRGIEKYLFCVPNIQSRTTLSRIRLSNGRRYIELKLSIPMAEIISTVMTCKYNRGTNYHTGL